MGTSIFLRGENRYTHIMPFPERYIDSNGEANSGRYKHFAESHPMSCLPYRLMAVQVATHLEPYKTINPQSYLPSFRGCPITLMRISPVSRKNHYRLKGTDSCNLYPGETPGVSSCVNFLIGLNLQLEDKEWVKHTIMPGCPLDESEFIHIAEASKLDQLGFDVIWDPTKDNPLHVSLVYREHIPEFLEKGVIHAGAQKKAAKTLAQAWEVLI